MVTILYGLLAAASFGFSDVLVTFLTQRVSVLLTLLIVQTIGCAVFTGFAGVALFRSFSWSTAVLLESVALGTATTLAYFCFYEALKKGRFPWCVLFSTCSGFSFL